MKKISTIAILALAAFIGFAAPATAEVTAYVAHGIDGDDFGLDPALPVDVWVEDLGCALPGFKFGDRIGPITVPAGDYDISIFLADENDPCTGAEVIDLDGVTLPDGANATVLAHRTFDGSPGAGDLLELGVTASLFANDFAPTDPGKGRVLVQHAALAPTVDVDVRLKGAKPNSPGVLVTGLTNPTDPAEAVMSQINAQFSPGNWNVTLEVAGTPVFGPTLLRLKPGTSTYVYAVGDFFGGTFQYLVFEESTKPVRGQRSAAKLNAAR